MGISSRTKGSNNKDKEQNSKPNGKGDQLRINDYDDEKNN
jgi:hypothetical protein